MPGGTVSALLDISLHIHAGSFSAIKGPSGSGKTTLLNLIATLDEPTAGTVTIGDEISSDISLQQRIELCREQIGYVFQTFALLPFLTAEENVQVPLRLLQINRAERDRRVEEALRAVGLSERASHRTHELSGGEQQRVAIARALVKRPRLILADEPTGQLDSLTGASIIALLRDIARDQGITVIVASHDPNVHDAAEWVYELHDGRLVQTTHQQG
jgi:putative ABC transport system ATP-binding protein